MFGYIIANGKILSENDKNCYKAAYCGLCRALKTRHGQRGRLTLTYDMTFLILVLSSLYEPEQCQGCERCFLHPVKKHDYTVSDISSYASDMNVALAYLNQMDNWHDDKNIFSLCYAKLLKKSFDRVSAEYPRQCGAMLHCMEQLAAFEKSGEPLPDAGAKLFGQLMGEIFVWKEDRWEGPLRSMADALGRFIYIMDAVMDLDSDIKKHSFNPLVELKNLGRNDEYFYQILTILMGDCTMEFDKLPLVENVSILRNILCSGVWTKYQLKQEKIARREGEKRQ